MEKLRLEHVELKRHTHSRRAAPACALPVSTCMHGPHGAVLGCCVPGSLSLLTNDQPEPSNPELYHVNLAP